MKGNRHLASLVAFSRSRCRRKARAATSPPKSNVSQSSRSHHSGDAGGDASGRLTSPWHGSASTLCFWATYKTAAAAILFNPRSPVRGGRRPRSRSRRRPLLLVPPGKASRSRSRTTSTPAHRHFRPPRRPAFAGYTPPYEATLTKNLATPARNHRRQDRAHQRLTWSRARPTRSGLDYKTPSRSSATTLTNPRPDAA